MKNTEKVLYYCERKWQTREAVWYAQANKQDKITLTSDGSISGNYTIPTGITLLIPFDAAGTLYKETPAYTTKTEEQGAFKTLTMKDGACINVDGAISVGGKHYTSSSQECCKTTGSYGLTRVCHLEMQNGVLCGLRFRCKYALCLVFTAFDFFENIYLHNIPT